VTTPPADPNTELLRLRQESLVLQAKVASLQDENKKLLARISELVSLLAREQNKDVQLALQLELKILQDRVADRNRDLFGKRSERLGNPDGPPKRADTHKPHTRPKRTGSKRTPQPDLPVVPVVHVLPEAQRCCPKCDGKLHARAGRGSVNTRIAVTARKYTLVEHRLQEYGCGSCGHTEQADPPAQLVPGGRYDTGIAVQAAVDKYQDHQPLERQVEQMRRQGVHITSQALWNQLWALFLVLVPSYEALHAELLTEALLYADETRWRLMNAYEVVEEEPEQDALFALQAASAANRVAMGVRAGRKVRKLQLGSTRERKLPPLCAEAGYFNLHAGVRVRAQDRAALERLCRYVARPPLSHARLKRHDDGDIALALKTPWSDGTSHVLLSELELVEKLAALVPTPNANLVTYTGVLAPAAKWRSLVVPAHERCSARGCQHGAAAAHASWIPWSDLLKRTFGVDALACACGGRLKVRAVVRGSWNAPKLLGVVGHPAAQTAWVAARAPPRDEVWC